MIKALILDIDGVILGHKEGVNFPLPDKQVQERLQILSKSIPISLCTVKAYFAVKPIIEACGLEDFFHVTDAGATIIQASTAQNTVTPISDETARELIEELRKSEIYTEWYSGDDYFALNHENTLIYDGRTQLLGRPATKLSQVTSTNISKIIALPLNEWHEASITAIAKKYTDSASLHWGINPSLIPRMAGFFTNPLATKQTGVEQISKLTNISLADTLAVGDSTNDWTFMELCGYVGTLGNGSSELKEIVTHRKVNSFVAKKTVNENGILEILKHFNL